MPSSIYSEISDIPTLAHAERSPTTAHEILLKLEASLDKTRDSLYKALKLCLAVEAERTEMARDPRFEKMINRPLADNQAEYEEMKTFLLHTKRANHIMGQPYHPDHLQCSSGVTIFASEELRSRIWTVVKVQLQKERRVKRMEELYAKEKDLVAGILQVRGVVRDWEAGKKENKEQKEKKEKMTGNRVLAKATGTRGRRERSSGGWW